VTQLSRRRFLGAAASLAAVGAIPSVSSSSPVSSLLSSGEPARSAGAPDFHGAHQAAALAAPTPAAIFTSFDVVASDRRQVIDLLRTVTDVARPLAAGQPPPVAGPAAPPADNGILGPGPTGPDLGVVISVGASLFDDRFGLGPQRPANLVPMAPFPNDDLQAAQCHGDIGLLLTASARDMALHAFRLIARATRAGLQPRWQVEGFAAPPRPSGTPRNLLGFKDGTSNPDVTDAAAMNRLVWVQPGDREPRWATGGTYQVVRTIRMLVEFWDRVSLEEQEQMFGRRKDTGAPLDGHKEFDVPRFDADKRGDIVRLDAHIRLANPRQPGDEATRILRRGFNYDRGLDVNGNIDVGLLFMSYQRDLHHFLAIQQRLIDEPLVDYVSPVGGGYFFALPGVADANDWYGSALLST
jgi:deferrochelatase/peroxidase EfeB